MKLNPRIGLFTLLSAVFFSFGAFSEPISRPSFSWAPLSHLAVQDRGRIKPFETFANETLLFVTGKEKWKGMSAVECLYGWLFAFDKEWQKEPFIKIKNKELKEKLGLEISRNYFSPDELETKTALTTLAREASQKTQRKERLSDLEQQASDLENKKYLVELVLTGKAWAIFPPLDKLDSDWFSLQALISREDPLPYPPEKQEKLGQALRGLIDSFIANDASRWNDAVADWVSLVRNDLGVYPSLSKLDLEVHYQGLRPFRWAWILYTIAFLLLVLRSKKPAAVLTPLSVAAILGAFLIHAYGFIIRCLIAGRPPVTNMYESVIWVSWGCMFFAFLVWTKYRNAIIPTAACVFSTAALAIADNLPSVLDPSIHPLEPVLRSNFWLSIHVLTITLSYAAFALSLCLGNLVLGHYIWKPDRIPTIQMFQLYMYRAIQIGVVLIAAGTILGGVWADYSWGRFWGWDPKEVWALIALLLYLAVLHGRFSGWLKGFGFTATTVLAFLGVLMAWYGVNFVLGAGLHSYGFGTGGLPWVIGYVAIQIAFMIWGYSRWSKVRAKLASDPAIFPK